MNTYLTLGHGKSTKVLCVAGQNEARTITTCEHDAAASIARALLATYTRIESALYRVAVEASGEPVQARRQLLGVYDTAARGTTPTAPSEAWSKAYELVTTLATATHGQPDAVLAAVRAELATHLEHLDGVLVPARVTSTAYRAGVCDVVISAALACMSESWWEHLEDAKTAQDSTAYPVGEPILDLGSDLEDVAYQMWFAQSVDASYAATDIAELAAGDRNYEQLEPLIPARLFHAWVAANRPAPVAGAPA